MRPLYVLVLLAFASSLGVNAEAAPWPPENHSEHVASVAWSPREPQRGNALAVEVETPNATELRMALVRVCRVEAFPCRAPIELASEAHGAPAAYRGVVPWDAAFYRGVRTVGLAIILVTPDGSKEESPVDSWPERPEALPDGAGHYYFHTLPEEPRGLPWLGPAASLLLFGVAVWLGRRSR